MKATDGLKLIEQLGVHEKLTDEAMADIVEFVRVFVNCGRKGEDLVATKVRMYEEQKTKRSSRLPPDPNSLKHDILRKHHQAYTWMRCLEPIVETLSIYEYGWKAGNEGVPVWYTCPQFPPGNQKRKKLKDVGDPVNPREPERMGMDSQRNDDVDNNLEHSLDDQSQSLLSLEQILDVNEESDDDNWGHLSDFGSTDDSGTDDSDWEG